MAYNIKQLRELSDEKLIAQHDEKAKNTVVGTKYYMEELDRRSREGNDKAMFKLTVISAITSILAIVVSVIAVFN